RWIPPLPRKSKRKLRLSLPYGCRRTHADAHLLPILFPLPLSPWQLQDRAPALAPFHELEQAVPSLSTRCRAQPPLCRRRGASRGRHRPHETDEVHVIPPAADIQNHAAADHHWFRGGMGFARGREEDHFAWHTS